MDLSMVGPSVGVRGGGGVPPRLEFFSKTELNYMKKCNKFVKSKTLEKFLKNFKLKPAFSTNFPLFFFFFFFSFHFTSLQGEF